MKWQQFPSGWTNWENVSAAMAHHRPARRSPLALFCSSFLSSSPRCDGCKYDWHMLPSTQSERHFTDWIDRSASSRRSEWQKQEETEKASNSVTSSKLHADERLTCAGMMIFLPSALKFASELHCIRSFFTFRRFQYILQDMLPFRSFFEFPTL